MKNKFNVLIVGFGYWGPILARNFQSNLRFNIVSICDSNPINLNRAKSIYPNILYYRSYEKAIQNPNVDFVVVSTPTPTHYKIVKLSLKQKKKCAL